jgi:hypothetical protein
MFFDSDDDDSLSCGDIDYVEELPSELVNLEEENDEDIDTQIQDEALREKLLNINVLISKIEAINEKSISSPILVEDSDFILEKPETFPELEAFSDDSIPEFQTFRFDHMGEKINGSTTSHSHLSLPVYESFTFEEFSGELLHIYPLPLGIELFEQNDLNTLSPENDSSTFSDFTVFDISVSFLSEDKIFKPGILLFEKTHMDDLSYKMSFNDQIHNMEVSF